MQLKTAIMILKNHQAVLSRLGVRSLSVFGSTARNENRKISDIDILIDYNSKNGIFAFIALKNHLEMLLGCKVDLVTKNALHPALKTKILNEAKNVF